MKKLPIGISNLREIVEEGYAYVDKSRFVHELSESGKYYFLSRPRRFGKSLFIDTLKEAFEGNRELFRGLWLHDRWDWDRRHPVIHISFGSGMIQSRAELDRGILDILRRNRETLGISCHDSDDVPACFGELIRNGAKAFGRRTVVLVDEYDKPILDNIADAAMAAEVRDGLKNLYSVIKDHDAWIEFALLTGVSKFSKVSLFSGLNNLRDITIHPDYSSICGYTEPEMVRVFSEHLADKVLEDIRHWYNGYAWMGEKVYNPFSILNYLADDTFRNYWFETGTPAFLIELLRNRRYSIPAMEHVEASDSIIGAFDVDFIEPENLLFQTGYLTIESARSMAGKTFYRLRYPNREVKASLSDYILNRYFHDPILKERNQIRIFEALRNRDMEGLHGHFRALFASIPHDWHRRNRIAEYEGYYASVFYCHFVALGLDVTAEDATNRGRVDMAVRLEDRVFLFEFKVTDIDRTPGTALAQIRERGYAEKYRADAAEIFRVGIEFDRNERNIVRFEWERA